MNILENAEILSFLNKKDKFINIEEIPREASTRLYYRVNYPKETRILCVDEKFTTKDYPFLLVQNFLQKNQILVPEIIDFDEKHNLILQSDAGEKDLTTLDQNEYELCLKESLDLILKLQEIKPIEIISSRSFDYNKLNFEINHTYNGYEKFITERKWKLFIPNEVKYFFEECTTKLANYSHKVICHRDYHARNILLGDSNQLFWIDFQDMMMGTPQYDLVSILYDAYKPITLQTREKYYNYFKENSSHKMNKFREFYLLQALQRSFKALGTYFVMFNEKGFIKYKSSISPCLNNILEIIELGKFPDYLYLFFNELKSEWELSKD